MVKEDFNIEEAQKTGQIYHPRGVHGYDHEHPLMRAIFVARGPAFPHTPGSKVEAFQNTEVYNIVCDSVGITPKPNNGTLRLPLKPVGIHDSLPPYDLPEDMAGDTPSEIEGADTKSAIVESASSTQINVATSAESSSVQPVAQTSQSATEDSRPSIATTDVAEPTRPVIQDNMTSEEEDKENTNLWWDWVKGKLDGVKDWATDVYDKVSDKVASATSKNGD